MSRIAIRSLFPVSRASSLRRVWPAQLRLTGARQPAAGALGAAVIALTVVAAVPLGVPAAPAWASPACFTVTGNVVSAGSFCTGDVTLPDGVTSIADNAFDGSGLTSIVIPKSVTSIGEDAFRNSGLTSIVIPNSVESIGNTAFYNLLDLTLVTFEPGSALTTIGVSAFRSPGLTSIVIPKSVTSIGDFAFYSPNSALTLVMFEPGSALTTIGVAAFDSSGLTSIVIPKSVTSIGDFAFSDSFALSLVTFEAGSALQTIGSDAFAGSGLTSIVIPKSVTSIGDGAFYANIALSLVTFEAGSALTMIGTYAFDSSGLTSIVIPKSVTSIGDFAFSGSFALSLVTFEAGSALQTIGSDAFRGSGLTSIVIPKSVTSIGVRAFSGNSALSLVTFEAGSALQTIGSDAFRGSGLTSIEIPKSVMSIGVRAFSGTSTLTSVTFEGNAPSSVGSNVFNAVADGATANIGCLATGFVLDGDGLWNGLRVVRAAAPLKPEFDTPVATVDGFTVAVTNYDGTYSWAAMSDHGTLTAGAPEGKRLQGVVTGLAPGQQATVTVTTTCVGHDSSSATVIGVATEGADAAPVDVQTALPSVTCSPLLAQVGSLVTCTVTGGGAGVDILWRAAYNPVFAGAGVTLDASGAGTFSFVVPAAALGQPITVELVDWAAPVSIGVAGGPVPTSVPSGGGPVPVWTLGLLALAGGLALRRGSRPGRSAWRVG